MKHETAVPVGSGGMGDVFKAWDPDLERHVALKYLKHDDPILVERLMREARAQARVDHPSVCKVYEVGEDNGRPYIAMEYVDGRPLDEAAADLSLEHKVLLVRQVAEAIQAAHSVGLVHRDLKPANILVVDRDGLPHPYVLDFGIARIEEVAGLTLTGQVMGTPGYLSPEQARGDLQSIDRRTDVFSLGVILYELLAGRRPFAGDSNVEILLHLIDDEPEPLRRVAPGVPRDLETVVMTCLEKDPHRRYPSAQALADDLGRWLAGEPVAAQPVGPLVKLSRTIRRHRAVAATAAVFIAIGLAGIAKYTVDLKRQQRHAEAARAEAENLVAFMLDDLFDSLEPLGRLDLLEEVAREADGYYRRFDDRKLRPEERFRRAIALRNLATVLDAQGYLTEGLEGLRRAAAIFSDELESGSAPPACNAELATTRSKIAESLQELGDLPAAVAVLEDALTAARRLAAMKTGDSRCHALLVELLNNMAWVLREAGDTESATARVDEALAVAGAASSADPTSTFWRFRLAETESYAARIRQEAGDLDDALAYLESARHRLVELADEEPNNTRWRFELVLTDDRLGWLAEERGDPSAAEQHYRQGLERGILLVRHDPANALWEREVSVLHSSLGALQLAAGDAASARDSFDAGLEISDRLVTLSPASTSAVNDLAWDWLQLGTAEEALGREAEARRAYERAVELMGPVVRKVRELWYLDTWVMALLHLGRANEAEDAVAELLAAGWDEPDFLELVERNGLAGSTPL